MELEATRRRQERHITPYSRIGHSPSVRHEVRSGFGEGFQSRGSIISRTHPHHLTASRPAPDGALRWWDVVNTTTLSAIAQSNEEHPSQTQNMKPKGTRRDLEEEVEQFILV